MKRKVNQDSRKHHLFPNFSEVLVQLLPKAELLNVELFNDLREAKVLIEQWRKHYNTVRPHTSLGYQPPAPETIVPAGLTSTVWRLRPDQPSIERTAVVT